MEGSVGRKGLRFGWWVGNGVGQTKTILGVVGAFAAGDGFVVGDCVGCFVVGDCVGFIVVGACVGRGLGRAVGAFVGNLVGADDRIEGGTVLVIVGGGGGRVGFDDDDNDDDGDVVGFIDDDVGASGEVCALEDFLLLPTKRMPRTPIDTPAATTQQLTRIPNAIRRRRRWFVN